MKADTTLKQAGHLLKLIDDAGTPREQLRAIYDSGLFSALLKANIAEIDKEQFLKVCGLQPSVVLNQHGHYIITVTGLNLTGAEEIARRQALGGKVSVYASQVLTSTGTNSYDAKHRLPAGKEYRIAIVPGKLIVKNRTTRNLRAYGASFGYQNVLAGHMPRIRETISNKQMENEMGGIWYIAGLHDPIKDSGGDPNVLYSHRDDDVTLRVTRWDGPEREWDVDGAFVFVVPQVGA